MILQGVPEKNPAMDEDRPCLHTNSHHAYFRTLVWNALYCGFPGEEVDGNQPVYDQPLRQQYSVKKSEN